MRILKQPSGMDFTQPLLNRLLRVYVALMYTANNIRGGSSSTIYYNLKSRKQLDPTNWRVKIIRKFGT